jgi:hypothetical protein
MLKGFVGIETTTKMNMSSSMKKRRQLKQNHLEKHFIMKIIMIMNIKSLPENDIDDKININQCCC